jgi:hypothetical protein
MLGFEQASLLGEVGVDCTPDVLRRLDARLRSQFV